MPRGADTCVFTAPHLVSDRRRALLADMSEADALGWARTPHVAAYARCRYRGDREVVVWRVLIDGELSRDDLPMRVRWEEACEADACDLPIARWDGDVLELRSPVARRARSDRGAEGELLSLVGRESRVLEARASDAEVSYLALVEGGVREVARAEARRERTLAWEEIEILAGDRRLRREHALDTSSERFSPIDAVSWSDGDAVVAQLELRLQRLRRRTVRRARGLEELLTFAQRALAERPQDGRVLELALSAYVEAGRIEEALALVDAAIVEADYAEERQAWARGLGWELAIGADHPSAAARLVAAGLASDEADGRALAPLLAEALGRDVVGETSRAAIEEEVRRMRALAAGPALTPLARPVVMAPLGLLQALVALTTEEPETAPLEIFGTFDVEGVPSATVAVLRDGTRLAMLPGRGFHAAHELGALDLVDAASEALRSPGDGPFIVEIRVGPYDIPTTVLRLSGTARRGRVSIEAVSAMAARWDWSRIARHLVQPFADAAELRFPEPELRWEGESNERLEEVQGELEIMRLADCALARNVLTCTPRAARARDTILAAARALEVLPVR